MSGGKVAEIRARHAATEVYQQSLADRVQMHNDRAWLRAEVERLTRERDEARAALKPFSELYLWPDDADEWTANEVRSDKDWDEERSDAGTDDVFIKRAHIRAARKALEAKP